MKSQIDLLQGTLDLLILKTLLLERQHGLGISRRIEQVTSGTFRVQPGSLFPALHRLERRGWIRGHWGQSENHRRARFYEITSAGRKQLADEKKNWERQVQAVARILQTC